MCGPCAKCYSSACRRGRSQQGCKEESAGEGATDGRELMWGRCVRMACVEGVTRAQRAAGMPGEPSRIELFGPLKVGRVSLGYLSAGCRYTTRRRGDRDIRSTP